MHKWRLDEDVLLEVLPNKHPPVEELFMLISQDDTGQENVMGAVLPGLGWTACYARSRKQLKELLIPTARASLPGATAEGKSLHILRFTNREEVEWT